MLGPTFLCMGLLQAQEFSLVDIQVSGNQRFSGAAVIAATGLRLGRSVAAKDVESAAKRLSETGLFAEVSYRYDPKTVNRIAGYAVTWQVQEAPVTVSVRLDFPGIDDRQLWKQLASTNALLDPSIPSNAFVVEYYRRSIEEALRKQNPDERVVFKNEVDLVSRRFSVVFRPANLPKIASVRFEGNTSIGGSSLQGALGGTSFIGAEYSEFDVRKLLGLNVKPLYEKIGRLTVTFPQVGLAGQTVIVRIEEGPVWSLGRVDLTPDSLPAAQMRNDAKFQEGKPANWAEFLEAVERAKAVLLRNGYLAVKAAPVPSFHDDTRVVDVTIAVDRGRQFLFGALELSGLSLADQQVARDTWKLTSGAPLDKPYVDEYVRELVPALSDRPRSVSLQLRPREGSDTIDVLVKFQ